MRRYPVRCEKSTVEEGKKQVHVPNSLRSSATLRDSEDNERLKRARPDYILPEAKVIVDEDTMTLL